MMLLLAILVVSFLAFTLSASAGLGGSLILVPALAVALGPKEGIAMASLFLALNNVGKVAAYRASIPYRSAALILFATILGSLLGSFFLLISSEFIVGVGVVLAIGMTLVLESVGKKQVQSALAGPLAFLAGGVSGYSGTSGPLKGLAIRSLGLPREQFVGAASLVSLAGDASKLIVFSSASLLQSTSLKLVAVSIPLMVAGVLLGRKINQTVGERGYSYLFWFVMVGYSLRLISSVF